MVRTAPDGQSLAYHGGLSRVTREVREARRGYHSVLAPWTRRLPTTARPAGGYPTSRSPREPHMTDTHVTPPGNPGVTGDGPALPRRHAV